MFQEGGATRQPPPSGELLKVVEDYHAKNIIKKLQERDLFSSWIAETADSDKG